MDFVKVWVPPREHLSVQAMFGAACFILEKLRKAKFHTLDTFETSKYQNLPIYKLSTNHSVITLFEIFGSVSRNLQSTVSLDHPVVSTDTL